MDLLLRRRAMMIPPVREEYIVFADPVVEQICATNWGDGVGITPSQAARVTNIGWSFKDNSQITSFDELQYFTGLTTIPEYGLSGCGNLTSIIFPEGLLTFGWAACQYSGITFADIPSTITHISEDCFYRSNSSAVFICRATTPPTMGYEPFGSPQQKKIYVPYSADHSILAAYQASSAWGSYTGHLYELNPDGSIPS